MERGFCVWLFFFFFNWDSSRVEFDVFPASSYKSFMNKCVENGLCYQAKSAWVGT